MSTSKLDPNLFTGFWYTDSLLLSCPKCKSASGLDCRTPKGRKVWPPHGERLSAISKAVGGYKPWHGQDSLKEWKAEQTKEATK